MQRKRFNTMACPIARGLDRVGEWWSMLILRDGCAGPRRHAPDLRIVPGPAATKTQQQRLAAGGGLLGWRA